MITIFGITLLAFLLVIAGMAVGVVMGRREIRGSCGGLGNTAGSDGDPPSCSLCSDPDAACRELGRRMQGQSSVTNENLSPENHCEKDCAGEGCSKEAIDACKQA